MEHIETESRFPSYAEEVGASTKPARDILLVGMGMRGIFDQAGGSAQVSGSSQTLQEFKDQGIEVVSTGLSDPLLDTFLEESAG